MPCLKPSFSIHLLVSFYFKCLFPHKLMLYRFLLISFYFAFILGSTYETSRHTSKVLIFSVWSAIYSVKCILKNMPAIWANVNTYLKYFMVCFSRSSYSEKMRWERGWNLTIKGKNRVKQLVINRSDFVYQVSQFCKKPIKKMYLLCSTFRLPKLYVNN